MLVCNRYSETGFGKYLWKISKEELIKMGRKGPKLVPFLLDGLKTKKYRNLMFENSSRLIFSLCLPHKTNKLDKRDEYIFKDWYQKNNKKYSFSKHYTVARQAMTASLRKSDYVEKILIGDSKMTYRILTSNEVKEKKQIKQDFKKWKKGNQSESDASSGYGSDMDSPNNAVYNINENNEVLHAIKHDHDFYLSPIGRLPCDENVLQQNDLKIELVDMEGKSIVDCGVNSDIFITNHTYMECSYENAEDMDCSYENAEVLAGHEKFVACKSEDIETNVNLLDEVQNQHDIVSLDDLMKIPLNDFLKSVKPVDFDLHELFPDENIKEFSKKPQNRFICKKLDYLGDTPILFCEYLDSGVFTVETSGELKIIFDEAMLKQIQNLNLKMKDYKTVNGHLLVILEPDTE
ncbi:hypothetical protein CDAR_104942 [Caerostris darwini]|uniref:Uncharacterized protein n=1 Tax=Caerostris darwini TaxID=1538125 RepID=A0AAV4V579_9ARAC|nr:hypothetical protein CDAR_104942 [Caerostris darwini]